METRCNVVQCPTWAERRIIASRYQWLNGEHTVKLAADEQRLAGRLSNLGGARPLPENETAAPLGRDGGNLSRAVIRDRKTKKTARRLSQQDYHGADVAEIYDALHHVGLVERHQHAFRAVDTEVKRLGDFARGGDPMRAISSNAGAAS